MDDDYLNVPYYTLDSCKNLAYQACSKILHILPEILMCDSRIYCS